MTTVEQTLLGVDIRWSRHLIETLEPQLKQQVEAIANHLQLVDGIFHVQFLFDGNQFYIIDVTPAMFSDLYPVPVSKVDWIDWAQWIVTAEAGRHRGFPRSNCTTRF